MEPIVMVMLTGLTLFLVFLLCFYFYLRIIKIKRFAQEEKLERIKKEIRPVISAALEEETTWKLRLSEKDTDISKAAIQEVLLEYMNWINDEHAMAGVYKLAAAELTETYQKQLRSKKISSRLNALYFIENFYLTELEPDVLQLYKENRNNADLHPQASRTLAVLESSAFMKLFFHNDSEEPSYLYKEVIRRLNEKNFYQWIKTLAEHPNQKIREAVLAIAAQKGDWNTLPLFEKAAEDEDLEVRLQAYKGFEKLGVVPDKIAPADIAVSEHWPERMMAARLWKISYSRGVQSFVRELIKDSSWWVRYYAGEALSYHSNGEEELLFIQHTSDDPFARDMAGQWLDAMKGEEV